MDMQGRKLEFAMRQSSCAMERTTGAPPLASAGASTQMMMKAMKALLPTHTSVAYGSRWKKCTLQTPMLTTCRRFDDLASVPLRSG